MKNSFFKRNSMFIVFLFLAFIALGVSLYTGFMLADVEYNGTTALVDGTTIVKLVAVLTLSMIAVVLCGFWGINLYAHKAKQAEKASNAKTEFFSRISHDMRTPMSAILGLCRVARESDELPVVMRHLESINDSAEHLLMLINDVMDMSKIESGKLSLDLRPADLYDEIDKMVGIALPSSDARGKKITVSIAKDVPRYVRCDCMHLRQVIVNLLGNAVKFTSYDGFIELSVAVAAIEGGRVGLVWHVKDNGVGMDSSLVDGIFSPFGASAESGKTLGKYKGTGLGLPIAANLVRLMGGSISVKSAIGEGSDFCFDIWVESSSYEEYSSLAGRDSGMAEAELEGKRVLVFEDLSTNRTIAEDVLRKLGAQVDFAANGLQGVNIYTANPDKYDYIFMDIKMPVMDGYEAARRIRNSGLPGCTTIPIIAMTANAFKEDAVRAIEGGMNAHIGKPFRLDDVRRALRGL